MSEVLLKKRKNINILLNKNQISNVSSSNEKHNNISISDNDSNKNKSKFKSKELTHAENDSYLKNMEDSYNFCSPIRIFSDDLIEERVKTNKELDQQID